MSRLALKIFEAILPFMPPLVRRRYLARGLYATRIAEAVEKLKGYSSARLAVL